MQPLLAQAAWLSVIAFFLHAAWEHAHLVLYQCASKPYKEIAVMMWQAVFGDVLLTLAIFVLFVMAGRRCYVSMIVGVVIAAGIEYHAVFIAERWAYSNWMPTIWGIGLSPLLQMAVVPAFAIWLSTTFFRSGPGEQPSAQ